MYLGLHVKYWLISSDFNPLKAKLNPIFHLLALLGVHHIFYVSGLRFNETLILSTDFMKKPQISYFMRIRAARAELFHVYGQTDTVKLTVTFRKFSKFV